MLRIFSFLLFTVCTTGGDRDGGTSAINCTSGIASSVYATVYDESEQLMQNPAPGYSVNGGSKNGCEQDEIRRDYCAEIQSGTVTIYVNVDGYEAIEEMLLVEADEYHDKLDLAPSG